MGKHGTENMKLVCTFLLLCLAAFPSHAAGLISLSAAVNNLGTGASTTLTAILAGPAGAGGQSVILQYSDSSNLTAFPGSLFIPQGQDSASVTVTAGTVSSNTIVAITAS